MSLINDALKRAKQAQQPHSPVIGSSLQFRPADPGEPRRERPGIVLPATLAVILVVGAISLWQTYRNRASSSREFAAPPAKSQPSRTIPAAAPAPKATVPSATATAADPAASNPPPTTAQESPAALANSAPTNALAPMAPPKPRPPKLQAIVFDPTRPSAIISGKSVFVGDRVGEFQVARIDRTSATLVSDTATNILTLE